MRTTYAPLRIVGLLPPLRDRLMHARHLRKIRAKAKTRRKGRSCGTRDA